VIAIDEVIALIQRQMRGGLPAGRSIDESTKLQDLGLSSLQIAEVVFTLEERHEVEFDPARAADAVTLGDLLALGNEALAGQTR
jgi:acyl carrier protein